MANELEHKKSPSALKLAMGERGYVAPPVPVKTVTMQARMHGKTSAHERIMARAEEDLAAIKREARVARGAQEMLNRNFNESAYPHVPHKGPIETFNTYHQATPESPRSTTKVVTVEDAMALVQDAIEFTLRYGRGGIAHTVLDLTSGQTDRIHDLPPEALKGLSHLLRRY